MSRRGPLRMSPEGKIPRTIGRKTGMGHNSPDDGYLDGQLLIAMPVMGDPRFERSVIYMCAHSSEGAMGIIVNHPAGSIDFPGLLVQLDIIKTADQIKLQEDADPDLVFGVDVEEKYSRALRKIGIDPGMLSNEAGHA